MENWLPIKGYEKLYEVSDLGRVKSLARTVHKGHMHRAVQNHAESFLRGCLIKGALRITLYDNQNGASKRSKYLQLSRIVWEHFGGEIPEKTVVRYKDEDVMNCSFKNLFLMTRAELLEENSRGRSR